MAVLEAGLLGLGSVIGGAIGAIGQGSANHQNRKIAEAQNALNYKMFKEQNAFNLAQWQRQNDYNDPSAQVRRLRAAGINPALAMGNISPGQAEALTSANASPAVGAQMQNSLAYLGQGVQNGLQAGVVEAQRKSLVSQAVKNLADAGLSKKSTELADDELDIKRRLALSQEALNDAKILEAKAMTDRIKTLTPVERTRILSHIRDLQASAEFKEGLSDLNRFELHNIAPFKVEKLKAEIRATTATAVYMASSAAVNYKQIELIAEQVLETSARRAGVELDNIIKRKGMPFVVLGIKKALGVQDSQIDANRSSAEANRANAKLSGENAKFKLLDNIMKEIGLTVATGAGLRGVELGWSL